MTYCQAPRLDRLVLISEGENMKRVLNILTMLMVLSVVFLAMQNSSRIINLTIWGTMGVNDITPSFKIVYVIIGLFALGFLAGICWIGSHYFSAQGKLKEYKRKLEQTSIGAEHKDSRVTVLEAKIEVLEKALKSALEKTSD